MRKISAWAASVSFVVIAGAALYVGPGGGLSGRSEALGDATRPYVLASPIFSPKTATSFTTLFTSYEDVSMSMLLRRYDAVGTLLTSQAITIGAHGSLQASPAAHSGAPLHVEIWAPLPHVTMQITYTNSSDVVTRIDNGSMHQPDRKVAGVFAALAPARACDTRRTDTSCPGGKVGPAGEIAFQLAGVAGVPGTGVSAVVVNLTATGGTLGSYLTVWPDGTVKPVASSLNFAANQTIANMVTVKLGTNGKLRLSNAAGNVHVVMDVAGYYT